MPSMPCLFVCCYPCTHGVALQCSCMAAGLCCQDVRPAISARVVVLKKHCGRLSRRPGPKTCRPEACVVPPAWYLELYVFHTELSDMRELSRQTAWFLNIVQLLQNKSVAVVRAWWARWDRTSPGVSATGWCTLHPQTDCRTPPPKHASGDTGNMWANRAYTTPATTQPLHTQSHVFHTQRALGHSGCCTKQPCLHRQQPHHHSCDRPSTESRIDRPDLSPVCKDGGGGVTDTKCDASDDARPLRLLRGNPPVLSEPSSRTFPRPPD